MFNEDSMETVTCPNCGDMFITVVSPVIECPCCCEVFSYNDAQDGADDYDEADDIELAKCPKCNHEFFTDITKNIMCDRCGHFFTYDDMAMTPEDDNV